MFGCWSRAAASASRRKRCDEGLVVGQVLGQQLHRHGALEHRVARQEDGRHAAGAEAALDPVAAGDLGRRAHSAAPSSRAPGLTPPPLPVPWGIRRCRCRSVAVVRERRRIRLGRRRVRLVCLGSVWVVSVWVVCVWVVCVWVGSGCRLVGVLLAAVVDQVPEVVEALRQRVADVRVHVVRERVDDPPDLGLRCRPDVLAGALRCHRRGGARPRRAAVRSCTCARGDRLALLVAAAAREHHAQHEQRQQRRCASRTSLAAVEALGEHRREPRLLDRSRRLVDRVLHPAPGRRSTSRCRAGARRRAGRRRAAGPRRRG